MNNRDGYINLIDSNIKKCGYHVYMVKSAGPLPRFEYTIGLKKELGVELIMAGALLYTDEEVKKILDESILQIKENKNIHIVETSLGKFSLRNVDKTWVEKLMLGALDYYDVDILQTLQVVPINSKYLTIDIPNLSTLYSIDNEPIWKWLTEKWTYGIPNSSTCATNKDALRGHSIIQAIRWEEDYWEIFSKFPSEITEDETLLVPIGIIIEHDDTNKIIATLSKEQAASRDDIDHDWEIWNVDE